MGYEYFLVRDDNKTLFELGKARGGLQHAFKFPEAQTFTLPIAEILQEDLLVSMAEYGTWIESVDKGGFSKWLAKHIITWSEGFPIRCVGEFVADDLKEKKYKVTATRYIRDTN